MGTANNGILRAMTGVRDAQGEIASAQVVVQEVLARVTALQTSADAQNSNIAQVQSALVSVQEALNGLSILPSMQTQIQAIYDKIVTTK